MKDIKQLSEYSEEEHSVAWSATVNYFEHIERIDMNRMQLQLDYAKMCINAWIAGTQHIILSAPTGFGKSLLAFFLTKYIRMLNDTAQSYMLTSNKFLQMQYADDISAFSLDRYAMLKGQSNYSCTENGLTFRERACSDQSLTQLEGGFTKYKCATNCPYIVARRSAIESVSAIFNYSYWLTAMNKVWANNPNAVFSPRELTVFDECHVLGNIVQDMFTIEFNPNQFIRRTINAFSIIYGRLHKNDIMYPQKFTCIVDLFTKIQDNQDNHDIAYSALVELTKEFGHLKSEYAVLAQELVKALPHKEDGSVIKTKEESDMISYVTALVDIVTQFSAQLKTYSELGHETIVIQFRDNDTKYHKPIEHFNNRTNFTMQLQCTNESELVRRSVLTWSNYSLFMSATIGHIDDWAQQSGITNYIGLEAPQVFDYSPSPIFKVTPMISMSYRDKHANMKKMIDRIINIVNHHPNERGLIHTGNYEIMNELARIRHPRILTYANSSEKEDVIRLLQTMPNAVIVGPSLVEGIDLKDDLCRFLIFAKVPFLSLADKLTKRKMILYKNWYNWVTLTSVQQGMGRGIRNNADWCITYLLDSAFDSFFARYPPPKYINDRIFTCEYNALGVKHIDTSEEDFDELLAQMQQ